MAGKQSKQSKKAGRNKLSCDSYKRTNRREHNKLRRLKKHLVRYPNDDCAKEAVSVCKKVIGILS